MMVRLLQPDGNLRHALATIVLRTDPGGEEYFVVHLEDVSEEIAAQDRLRLIVENTPVSMFLVDRNGRVLVSEGTVSPEAAAGLREARASSIFTAFTHAPQAASIMRRALDRQRVHQVIEAFGRRLDVHLVPIPGPGGRMASVASVASDVTDLHLALASLRARSAEQAVVADLGRRALEARDPAGLWERAVTALADHLGADLVRAHGLDADGKRVRLLARKDRREPEVPTGRCMTGSPACRTAPRCSTASTGHFAEPATTDGGSGCSSSTSTASRRSTTPSATRPATTCSAPPPPGCHTPCGGGDVAGRLTGDEFAVLCEDVDGTADIAMYTAKRNGPGQRLA